MFCTALERYRDNWLMTRQPYCEARHALYPLHVFVQSRVHRGQDWNSNHRRGQRGGEKGAKLGVALWLARFKGVEKARCGSPLSREGKKERNPGDAKVRVCKTSSETSFSDQIALRLLARDTLTIHTGKTKRINYGVRASELYSASLGGRRKFMAVIKN